MITYAEASVIAASALMLGHIIGSAMAAKDRKKSRLFPYMLNTLKLLRENLVDDRYGIDALIEVAEGIEK